MTSENDCKVIKRRHFAKLHERIQNKYNEMQRRIEKSKSVDSLLSVDEENVFNNKLKYASTNNLSEVKFVERDNSPVMHTVIVEDIISYKQEAIFTNIGVKEVSVSEFEVSVTPDLCKSINESPSPDKDIFEYGENHENIINTWSISSESLNDSEKKCDEITSSPPTPKISIRDRIGSRISAARERRREEKEKNLLKKKEKEKETLEAGTKFIFSNSTKSDFRLKDKRIKLATVAIALIEVTGLDIDANDERQRTLLCRFRMGVEKHKSKPIKNVATSNVKWQEQFMLNMYDENSNLLEVYLWDVDRRDTLIGKTTVDLIGMEKEKTHAMKITLQDGSMSNTEIFFLLTITATAFEDLLIDFDNYLDNCRRLEEEGRNFAFHQLKDFSKVGQLYVIVYGAKGLSASDCYCNLKLVNEIRQTHTEYKTNEPNWMKTFTFNLTDITSILQVIVYDEKKEDEVGRVAIPLLKIKNGAKIWYILKDTTLRDRAKGNNPRILIEMIISWNIIKASARVIKPKEIDFLEIEDKFDRKLFFKNIARAKTVVLWTNNFLKDVKACFEWESRKWNTIGIIAWLLFIWFFSPWMLPLLLIIPFIWYRPPKYFFVNWKHYLLGDIGEVEAAEKEERMTLRQKINNLHDLINTVQKFIGKLASFGESVKNLFNFSVPYLSILAIFFLVAISLFMYIIPVRYILLGWGIKKYVRKIIWPNRVGHSEILDLISRVPDDEVLTDCVKLPLDPASKLQLEEDNV